MSDKGDPGSDIEPAFARIARMAAEQQEKDRERNIESIPMLRQEIVKLEAMLKEHREHLDDVVRQHKRRKATEKAFYFVPLAVAVLFVAFLIWRGYAAQPTVSIDFNVGEIIGGLLAGVGALAAGIAYAIRRMG
jgi:hypothetical protein